MLRVAFKYAERRTTFIIGRSGSVPFIGIAGRRFQSFSAQSSFSAHLGMKQVAQVSSFARSILSGIQHFLKNADRLISLVYNMNGMFQDLQDSHMMVQVAQIVAMTEAEGPGRRFALWFQGCPLRCAGCCNPEMLPFAG